jgi:hypothetical protein
MGKRILLLSLTACLLVLSFQNCSKVVQNDSLFFKSPTSDNSNFEKTAFTEFRELWIPLINLPANSTLGANPQASWLTVDLNSGEMSLVDDYGKWLSSKGNVMGSGFSSLQSIIVSSNVCTPINNKIPNQMCTQVYTYPYAKVRNGASDVNLGEQRSGCEIPVDLCDNQGPVLKSWIQNLISSLN